MLRSVATIGLFAFAFLGCEDDTNATAPNEAPSSSQATADAAVVPSLDAGASATPDATAVTDVDASTADCGNRTGMRGLTNRTLTVGGAKRTYLVYLPASLDPKKPAPFVFVFHGYTMSGQDMHDITRYADLADSEGFGVAFPDGEGGPDSAVDPWNIENSGQNVCGAGNLVSASGDDFAFIDAMKSDVAQDQCTDSAHLFASGFSMGGYFTEHIGCYRNDFRALAPHSGGTLADLTACTTAHVPIILFHGTSDSVIDDACDDPTVKADSGFTASASLWAAKNGCKSTYTTIPNSGSGGGNGQCFFVRRMPRRWAGRALHVHRNGSLLGRRCCRYRWRRMSEIRGRHAAAVDVFQDVRLVIAKRRFKRRTGASMK